MNSKKKILFFIAGPVPDAAQMAQADKLTNTRAFVCFRNSLQVKPDDSVEKCDATCGLVPEVYKTKTARFEPPQFIDLEQPELNLAEAVPAAAPMAPVATEAPAEVAPAPASVEPAPAPVAPPPATKPAKGGKSKR